MLSNKIKKYIYFTFNGKGMEKWGDIKYFSFPY